MLNEKMEKALNGQVNAELYSAYLYLSMAANFSAQNWVGTAKWMRVQAREEMVHAMKIHDFVLQSNSKAALDPIAKPPAQGLRRWRHSRRPTRTSRKSPA